jgi:hypothetical protein
MNKLEEFSIAKNSSPSRIRHRCYKNKNKNKKIKKTPALSVIIFLMVKI